VGLDRNPGLHRFRRHSAGLGRRAPIRSTHSDFVCDYSLTRLAIRNLSLF